MRPHFSWIGIGIVLGCLALMLVTLSGCPSSRPPEVSQDDRRAPEVESSSPSEASSDVSSSPGAESAANDDPAASARAASQSADAFPGADGETSDVLVSGNPDDVNWSGRAAAARRSLTQAQAEQAAGDLNAALHHAITAANALPPKSTDLSGVAGTGSVPFQREVDQLRSQIESTLNELDESGAGAPTDNIPNPDLTIR